MNLLGHKKIWWLASSAILIFLSIIAISTLNIKLGIDFVGGSVLEIRNPNSEIRKDVPKNLEELNLENLTVTNVGEGILLKAKPYNEATKKIILEKLEGQEIRFETVGPTVSKDLIRKSIFAVGAASVGIVLYLAYAFRKTSDKISSWRLGLVAIGALIHDLLITTGLFIAAGVIFHFEIDTLFITALLTVMGFSVHDTIVVFDRIRENLNTYPNYDFEQVANTSLVQTMARSLNTSLTVIIVLLAMYLLGGDTIKPFVFTLIVGIVVGTYSSIFVATPLLVFWQAKSKLNFQISKPK